MICDYRIQKLHNGPKIYKSLIEYRNHCQDYLNELTESLKRNQPSEYELAGLTLENVFNGFDHYSGYGTSFKKVIEEQTETDLKTIAEYKIYETHLRCQSGGGKREKYPCAPRLHHLCLRGLEGRIRHLSYTVGRRCHRVRVRKMQTKEILQKNLLTENGVVVASHFARTLHKSHEETAQILKEINVLSAYDGLKLILGEKISRNLT